MKKAGLWLLAVLLVVTGGCGKPHTDTSDLSLPGEVSTSVTSHSHQTTTTTTTATTTTTTTTATTTTTTTKKPTTTTTVPTTTTTTVPTTTTTTVPTTTLPPGDYSAYERLAAAMARKMQHPGYRVSSMQLMSDLENDGGVRQSSENYFTYMVTDINDPLTDRSASCFWANDWTDIGQMEISFTDQKYTHFTHFFTGYYYSTDGVPAWATLYDGFLRDVATLPPAELMEGLEELPAVTVYEEGFTDSPFYKVSIPGDQFEKLYPGLMDFGVYLCNVDPKDIASVRALDARFYYAVSFQEEIRGFKLYFRLNIQGSHNGEPFDQIWRICIPDGSIGSSEDREILPVDEVGYEYVAVPFTETTDQGVFPLFSFPK